MKDDAGKEVRILNPNGFAEWPVKGDRRVAIAKARLYGAMSGRFLSKRASRRASAVPLGGIFLLGTITVSIALAFPNIAPWMVLAVWFPAFLSMILLWQWYYARENACSVVEVLLSDGLCPSCGYNLHSAATDAAGRTVCPECGAAWDRGRIVRCEAFAGGAPLESPLRALNGEPRWTMRVVDARGTTAVIPVGLMRSIQDDPAFAEEVAAVKRARRRWRVQEWKKASGLLVGIAVMVAGAALGGMAGVQVILRTATSESALRIAAGAVLIIAGAAWNRWQLRHARVTIVDDFLKEGLCPACLAALGGEMSSTETTMCVGCGAAWRLGVEQAGRM